MDGANDRTVERALVSHPTLSLFSCARCENAIQVFSKPFAHLVGSAIGKGDGNDLIDIQVFILAQDVKVSLDQDGRLARARSGGYRHVPVKRIRCRLLFGF